MKRIIPVTGLFTIILFSSCKKQALETVQEQDSATPGFSLPTVFNNPVDLGAAVDYTVLGLNGTEVNLSNVTINNGRVGVSQQGKLSLASPSTVNGDIYLHTGVNYTINGVLHGTLHIQQNLSVATANAVAAANDAASRTPTQTFNSWTSGKTIDGNGGINVVNVGNVNLGSGEDILLNGSPYDYYIINVSGSFKMSGNAQIKATGTTYPSHVIVNLVGSGTATTNIGNRINGTVLAINRSVTFHGITGQVICGGSKLTLMSGAIVNYMPYSNAPVFVFSKN